MPSRSLMIWRTSAATALDEIEAAHHAIGGAGPGRRYVTQQLNHAYAVLLASQFQRFCRDLHSEAVDFLIRGVAPPALGVLLRADLHAHRRLDVGNANPGNLGADFGRFNFNFWDQVKAIRPANAQRQRKLTLLNEWRNAIAHQSFNPTALGSVSLRLAHVRSWRRTCNGLAADFDAVLRTRLYAILGIWVW
jgi:hypothetical protein